MFGELISQVPTTTTTIPPVDFSTLINSWTSSVVGIMIAIGSLGGVIAKWIASRDHSPRITALETDMDNVKNLANELKKDQPGIVAGAGIVSQVMPGLQTAANAHEKEIAIMKKTIDDLTAKLNLLTTVVPSSSNTPTTTQKTG